MYGPAASVTLPLQLVPSGGRVTLCTPDAALAVTVAVLESVPVADTETVQLAV